MGCKDCLNRREFFARSAVAAAALAAIEGCGDGQIGPSAPNDDEKIDVTINPTDYPALATIGTLVRIDGQPVGIVRTGPSSFVASDLRCTHEGCITEVRGNQFSCPCHFSLFSATGDLLRGPATRGLNRLFVVHVAGTDTLEISNVHPPGTTA